MNTSTVISMIVGIFLPLLVVVITKAEVPKEFRQALILLASTVSGVLSGLVTSPPVGFAQSEHVALNITLTWATAVVSLVAGTRIGTQPIFPSVDKVTGSFGLKAPRGPSSPKPA